LKKFYNSFLEKNGFLGKSLTKKGVKGGQSPLLTKKKKKYI
jgi:hypothetical protein